MYIIGLTGGIGSGKSVVSNLFAELGVTVVDADIVAREVVEPDTELLQQLVEYFGDSVLNEVGELNRTLLREVIFADEQKRLWLEQLLHPAIGREMQRQLSQSDSPYQIQVAPLLLERGRPPHLQRVLVVDVPENLQIERTLARDDSTPEQVQAIMDSQLSREKRLQFADDILLNDGDMQSLKARVTALHQTYLQLAQTT